MGARGYSFDINTLLENGLVAVAAASRAGQATVNGTLINPQIIDLGTARVDAMALIDLLAIDIAGNDEVYSVLIQGSSSASFASDIQNLAQLDFGATEVRAGGAIDSVIGRYELPFTNEQGDVTYRYCRAYLVAAVASSTFTARVAAVLAP